MAVSRLLNLRLPIVLFAVMMIALGTISTTRPVRVASFFLRFVGQKQTFAAAHPRLTASSIRASGFIALLMGVMLLYGAFVAQ